MKIIKTECLSSKVFYPNSKQTYLYAHSKLLVDRIFLMSYMAMWGQYGRKDPEALHVTCNLDNVSSKISD